MKHHVTVLLLALFLPAAVAAQSRPAVKPSGQAGAAGGTPSRHVTPHLTLTTFVTEEVVAPGQRFSIVLDVAPGPGMHVYAPGKHDYRVITLRLEPDTLLRAYPMKYPKSVEYFFEPLNERVQVYEQPFRMAQEIEIVDGPAARALAQKAPAILTLKGALAYQACTEKICFPPEDLPLVWAVALTVKAPRAR